MLEKPITDLFSQLFEDEEESDPPMVK